MPIFDNSLNISFKTGRNELGATEIGTISGEIDNRMKRKIEGFISFFQLIFTD